MGKTKRKREDDKDDDDGGANSRACLPCVGDRSGPAAAADADAGDSDSEGPPMDGYAYLRRVMREARSCPKTVVAKNRDALLGGPAAPREAAARYIPDYLVPKRAWRAGVLADFRTLRACFAARATPRGQRLPDPPAGLPSSRDGTSWKAYCFGSKAGGGPHAPSLEALLSLEQVTVSWLVVCHKNWLCNSPSPHCPIPAELEGGAGGSTKLQSRYRMCHQALLGGVEGGACGSVSWLHTILACIEEPLAPADETALAELVYTLCQLWTQLDTWRWIKRWQQHYEEEAAEAPESATPHVPVPLPEGIDAEQLEGAIAVLVTIVHEHFKQGSPDLLWERD